MRKINLNWVLILLLIVFLPFERLLTFEVAGLTVKPAYLVAVIFIIWSSVRWLTNLVKAKDGNQSKVLQFFSSSVLQSKTMKSEEYLLLGIVIWSFLSSIWSLAPTRSFIYASLLALMITVFMTVRRRINDQNRQRIIDIIIWLGLAVSLLAILQFLIEPFLGYQIAMLREEYSSRVFGFPRPQATFLEPLYLANFLLWPIFLEINQKLKTKNQEYWKLIILLVAFTLTLSRGAYLGLVAGFIVAIIASVYLKKINWRNICKLSIAIVVAIVISFLLIFSVSGTAGVETFYQHTLSSADMPPSNQIEELKNRTDSQNNAITEIKQHFLLGIGLNAFGALPRYQPLRALGDWQTVNNEYLEIATELGVVGLLLFLSIIFLMIKYQIGEIKIRKYDNVVYLGVLVALLVQYLTFSSLYSLYLWVMLAIVWPVRSTESKVYPTSL